MTTLNICLENREELIINELGQVLKRIHKKQIYDIVKHAEDYNESLDEHLNKWKITGAWINKGGYIKHSYSVTSLFDIAKKEYSEQVDILKYKNGKYKLGLCDIDHGTNRYQMNNKIMYLRIEEQTQ